MDWIRHVNPRVNRVGSGGWNKGFVEPARRLYDHQLVIFEKGRCRMQIGRGQYVFSSGQWVIVEPDSLHHSEALSNGVLRHWAHFDWADSEPSEVIPVCAYAPDSLLRGQIHEPPEFIPSGLKTGSLNSEKADTIYALFDTLELRARHSQAQERLTAKAVFLEMLIRLFDSPTSCQDNLVINPSVHLSQVKTLLDQMPGADVSIKELMRSVGQSYEHLARAFKKEYNLTPVKYVNMLKMEHAKTLLRNARLNVGQVAEKCGYSNCAYFCRIFKLNVGMSPGEFRKQLNVRLA